MKHSLLAAAAALALTAPSAAQPAPAPAAEIPSPGEIAAAAPAKDWIAIPASDLLVMDLARDAVGKPRRVVIQLMPAPFSQGWVGNIRKLAAAHWWDGTSVNRVQDNYVAQWGDATEKKALPDGLAVVPESNYLASGRAFPIKVVLRRQNRKDAYTGAAIPRLGWPIALDKGSAWPVHCYGMVGVGRNLSPDTGSGAELYAVIGHAPRHLDRNIALVGRVISGIEYLSSLPRGTGILQMSAPPAGLMKNGSRRFARASAYFAKLSLSVERYSNFGWSAGGRSVAIRIDAIGTRSASLS